jgi:hypothetical protein
VAGTVVGEQSNGADPFDRVSFLIGRWEGHSEGQPGKGTLRREYAPALNGRFIRVRNRSEYPPQEKNPKRRPNGTSTRSLPFGSFDAVVAGNASSPQNLSIV